MRIFIAGGLGFIGGRLALEFIRYGHKVILGSRRGENAQNLIPGVEVRKINWSSISRLKECLIDIDIVVQAAGLNSSECESNPVNALKFYNEATHNLVSAAASSNINRYLYISTAHVYSRPLVGLISETTIPKNAHPYAQSHLAAEKIVLDATSQGQISGLVLRLSNAFGVPANQQSRCWSLLINQLCKEATETGKILLQDDCRQQRDFIAISTVSRIVEHILKHGYKSRNANIINVGTGKTKTILEVAELIKKRFIVVNGSEPKLISQVSAKADEDISNFTFITSKLISLDIRIEDSEIVNEIDGLLHYCRQNF